MFLKCFRSRSKSHTHFRNNVTLFFSSFFLFCSFLILLLFTLVSFQLFTLIINLGFFAFFFFKTLSFHFLVLSLHCSIPDTFPISIVFASSFGRHSFSLLLCSSYTLFFILSKPFVRSFVRLLATWIGFTCRFDCPAVPLRPKSHRFLCQPFFQSITVPFFCFLFYCFLSLPFLNFDHSSLPFV